jgi:hypothetical protein
MLTKLTGASKMWSLASAVESAPQVSTGASRLARVGFALLCPLTTSFDSTHIRFSDVTLIFVHGTKLITLRLHPFSIDHHVFHAAHEAAYVVTLSQRIV